MKGRAPLPHERSFFSGWLEGLISISYPVDLEHPTPFPVYCEHHVQ